MTEPIVGMTLWRDYLEAYSAEVLERTPAVAELLTRAQRDAGFLGHPGAPAERLVALEKRLGARLPASYRTFLLASDGWDFPADRTEPLFTTATVDWCRSVDGFGAAQEHDDPGAAAALERGLAIATGEGSRWFLDPEDCSPDGEWTAYLVGGGQQPKRFGSFGELFAYGRATLSA